MSETPMKLTTESRSCRSQARCMGVAPEGAHVRRRIGCSMKPLSSKKTIGLPRRWAPFLCGAKPVPANVPILRRRLPGHAARASGTSNLSRGASSPHDRGDTARGTTWPRLRPHGDTSIDPCRIRSSAVRPAECLAIAASASRSDGACGRDVVWQIAPRGLLSPQPDATVLPKMLKHQQSLQPPRLCCHPSTTGQHAVDALAVRLRFLSVSCLQVRMFTIRCSSALQGSIV